MIYKILNVKELEKVRENLPEEIYDKIFEILSTIDREYGDSEHRTIENDGGLVVYADSQEELDEAIKELRFDKKVPELIEVIGGYENKYYMLHNEWGANFFAPRKKNLKTNFKNGG